MTSGLGGSWLEEVDLRRGTRESRQLRERDGEELVRRHRHLSAALVYDESSLIAIDEEIATDVCGGEHFRPAIARVELDTLEVTELLPFEPLRKEDPHDCSSSVRLSGLGIDSDGQVLTFHRDSSASRTISLIRIDPGARSWQTVSSGDELCLPFNLTVDGDDSVVVACGSNETARVLRIHADGRQQILARESLLFEPSHVALPGDGTVLVSDRQHADPPDYYSTVGRVVRIEAGSGEQSIFLEGDPIGVPSVIVGDGVGGVVIGSAARAQRDGYCPPVTLVRVDLEAGGHNELFRDETCYLPQIFSTIVLLPESESTTLGCVACALIALLARRQCPAATASLSHSDSTLPSSGRVLPSRVAR